MGSIKKAVEEIKKIAKDNSHGYSQKNRTGNPDYDCSSLVIHCLDAAGFPVKKYGATYTGNMAQALRKCGFVNVISEIDRRTGKGLRAGDVLLNDRKHTSMMISATQQAAAHWDYDGKKGDSSGREISITKYSDYPWTGVWRYAGSDEEEKKDEYLAAYDCIIGRYGNGADRAQALKDAGYDYKSVQEKVNWILKNKALIRSVIIGDLGNGSDRVKALKDLGYDPDQVRKAVNAVLERKVINGII